MTTSQYKIMRVTNVHDYPVFKQLLVDQKNLDAMSYEGLARAYYKKKNCYSHGFIVAMEAKGNASVEVLYDFKVLQKKWADEHGIRYTDDRWAEDIFLAQVRHHKPDVVYSDRFFDLPEALRKERNDFPYVKVLAAQQGFPMGFRELRRADVVFSCTPSIANVFRGNGINAHNVYHAFDPAVLDNISTRTDQYDAVFSGHSGYGFDWHHRTRYDYLNHLLGHSCLEGWITERDITLQPDLEKPLRELHPDKTHDPVYGIEMYTLLRSSKVVFNMNPDSTYGYSGIMRDFEAPGVGACLLTSHSFNIAELYEPGLEVVTYSSLEECKEKLEYLLAHDEIRREIGERAQRRVKRDHLFSNRVELIDGLIKELLQ